MNKYETVLKVLRVEAERILAGNDHRKNDKTAHPEVERLLHELQVYQLELELQNEELRRAQEEVENERMRFKSHYELAPAGYFILNTLCVVDDCNNTGLAMVGQDRVRMIGWRFISFLVKGDSDLFYQFIHRLNTTGKKQSVQLKMISKDSFFYAQVEGAAIIEPISGETKYYIAVVDITDKINAELRQRESKERLEMALAALSTGTWRMHREEKTVELDKFAMEILGTGQEDFAGHYKGLISLVHSEDSSDLDAQLGEAISSQKEIVTEFRVRVAGKIRQVELRGHKLSDYFGVNYFGGTVMDITERRMLEAQATLMRMNQQKDILKAVFETQENERKLISTALHDSVGQLLYATKIDLEHNMELRSPAGAPLKALSTLDMAIKETRDISFMLAPTILLDFGLEPAVAEMINRVSTPWLTFKTGFRGLENRLDPSAEIFIFRISQELINNILKHSKASLAEIDLYQNNTRLYIRVKDNGTGFNADAVLSGGTGLSSIRNRVSLYNGSLTIESGKGKGTQVTVVLNDVK